MWILPHLERRASSVKGGFTPFPSSGGSGAHSSPIPFRAYELPSLDSGNMPASMVELGKALFKPSPFIPELWLWVFWAPIFIKLVRLGISEASI